MKTSSRHIIYAGMVVGILSLLYLSRAVLGPFVLAALMAYLLNPLVNFLTSRTKLPRTFSIALIYLVVIGGLILLLLNLGVSLREESTEFSLEIKNFINQANSQILTLPSWLQPVARDLLASLRGSLPLTHSQVMTYLPGAVNRTISVLVFLVATFYFLKDGRRFISGMLAMIPTKWWPEIEIITQKISTVLGNYLRGQLLLVLIMSGLTYLGLFVIGVRYTLILSIFTGLAEIVPYVGPVAAAGLAMSVAFVDNYSHIGTSPVIDAIAVLALYTVLRQLEDLFIIPNILGRVTKLHPLVVMFAVLAGGHLFGIVGFLVAVPFTASLKVVINHLLASPGNKR